MNIVLDAGQYDQYYLLEKANQCVVCGRADSVLRKNVVPHDYRRHFPLALKDHKSHDVLLLCAECHARSNAHDHALRRRLADLSGAPIGQQRDVKVVRDDRSAGVQRAANALLQSQHALPPAPRPPPPPEGRRCGGRSYCD